MLRPFDPEDPEDPGPHRAVGKHDLASSGWDEWIDRSIQKQSEMERVVCAACRETSGYS